MGEDAEKAAATLNALIAEKDSWAVDGTLRDVGVTAPRIAHIDPGQSKNG